MDHSKRRSPSGLVEAEYAELMGDICVLWNQLEDCLAYLLPRYLDNDELATKAVLSVLGNQSRLDLLAHLAREKEKDPEVLNCVLHFVQAFSICQENRNIIVHSAVRLKKPADPIYLEKPSRTKPGAKVKYAYDVDALKRVHSDISNLMRFAISVFLSIYLPLAWRLKRYEGFDVGEKDKPRPLPERPPLPTKLMPLGPEADLDAPIPLQSSRQ